MSTDFEKDFDDEVYEDSFYDEGEELEDEEEKPAAESEEDYDDEEEVRMDMSFACDDCDYRWDDTIVRRRDESEEVDVVCPMCGSMNITQI